jgi:ABC-type multidrug transport system ATPase subunit
MRDPVIRTEGLTKRYGGLVAVDGVDLRVDQGDLFGFLGPNGSGKTTTVRMLLGLVFATSGRIEVLGRPMPRSSAAVLPAVGSLVEGPAFYPHLSGRANLALFDAAGPAGPAAGGVRPEGSGGPQGGPPVGRTPGGFPGGSGGRRDRRRRIDDALGRVGLDQVGRRPVKAYSSGMRQRLGLAAALLRAPRLLVLDEPTNGLDPKGMREVRDLLAELVRGGATTVFLSSHLLAEVEQVCTRAAIVHQGRLVAQDRVEALLAPTGRVMVTTPDLPKAAELATALRGVRLGGRHADRLTVQLDGTAPEELNRQLVAGGVRVRELLVERPSLEDVFLKLTAGGARDAPG